MNNDKLKAILVDVIPPKTSSSLDELHSLVNTLGGIVVEKIIQKRGRPSAKTFLGTGKALEVAQIAQDLRTNVVIFNNILKPSQVLHLSAIFKTKVWDRVDLILKIFEKHAVTREAKLQIELAKLHHEFPKLYGKGTSFSQQRGGGASSGGMTGVRGPGEKFLEQKKRHLRGQINILEKQLEKIKAQRQSQREIRRRRNLKTIALVGYTNSGKSTLLKALTNKKDVYIANKLFATLDTKIGDMYIQNYGKILVADTIGFIKDLPTFLIKSFLATLEEALEADLILHVIDVSDPEVVEKIKVVEEILKELGCENKPRINILNKIDNLPKTPKRAPKNSVLVSAITRKGFEKLSEEIRKKLIQNNLKLQ